MGRDIIMLESKKDSFVHSFNLSEKQTPVFSTATIISLRFSFSFLGGVGGVGWGSEYTIQLYIYHRFWLY